MRRYVENEEEEEEVDVPAVYSELASLEKKRAEIDKKIEEYFKELGYK